MYLSEFDKSKKVRYQNIDRADSDHFQKRIKQSSFEVVTVRLHLPPENPDAPIAQPVRASDS